MPMSSRLDCSESIAQPRYRHRQACIRAMLGFAHAPNGILPSRTKTRGWPPMLRSGSLHSPGLIGSLAESSWSR